VHPSLKMSEQLTGRFIWLSAVVSVTALLALAGAFLPQQALWVDETTQLSGLTLGPVDVVRWLCGDRSIRFDVPSDRMPPVSYWAGMLWARVFNLHEDTLRWLGVVAVSSAVVFGVLAGRQLGGTVGSLVAGLIFALSPNVITQAVEIRAYPLLILLSSVAIWAFLRFIDSGSRQSLAGLVFVNIVAIYTHFYGLVLAGSLMVAGVVAQLLRGRSVRGVVVGGAITLVAAAGLAPFVLGAAAISPEREMAASFAVRVVRLTYRLVAHPAIAVGDVSLALVLAGTAVTGLLAVLRLQSGSWAARSIALALFIGVSTTAAAAPLIRTFDVLSPSYSTWMLPAVAVFLASATAQSNRRLRAAAVIGVGAVILGNALGASQLTRHGRLFSHGPFDTLAAVVNEYGAENVTVIHDGGSKWGHAYFPLRYSFGVNLLQYRAIEGADGLAFLRLPAGGPALDPTPGARRVITVTTGKAGWRDLRRHQRGVGIAPPPGSLAKRLAAQREWKLQKQLRGASFTTVCVSVFERTEESQP